MNKIIKRFALKGWYRDRPKINNERGDISLLGLFFVLISLSLIAFSFKSMIYHHELVQLRIKTYLCFKDGISELRSVYNLINKANIAIIGFNSAKLVNPIPLWDTLKRAAQLSQEYLHLKFKKNILQNDACTFQNKVTFLKRFPYKLLQTQLLKRTAGGITLLKTKKNSLKIYAIKNLRPYFSLHALYKFQIKLKLIKSYEKKLPGAYLDSLVQTSY